LGSQIQKKKKGSAKKKKVPTKEKNRKLGRCGKQENRKRTERRNLGKKNIRVGRGRGMWDDQGKQRTGTEKAILNRGTRKAYATPYVRSGGKRARETLPTSGQASSKKNAKRQHQTPKKTPPRRQKFHFTPRGHTGGLPNYGGGTEEKGRKRKGGEQGSKNTGVHLVRGRPTAGLTVGETINTLKEDGDSRAKGDGGGKRHDGQKSPSSIEKSLSSG